MIIDVIVKTNKKENKIKVENKTYKVWLKKKPQKNKANKELIRLLEDYFKKRARIILGEKSRKKRVEIF